MKYCIIYNNFAGLVYSRFSEDDVRNALGEVGIDFEFIVTTKPKEAIEVARCACQRVDGPIVACGGDGTVNEVMNGIVGSDRPLGIIPNGTSNLLAEELGIGHNLKDACAVLADRKFRLMDVGKANDRYFLMMAGIGFDAVSIEEINPVQKRFWGQAAYIFTGLRLLLRYKSFRVTVEQEEIKRLKRRRVRQIVISNIKSYGMKDIKMAPNAHFDDGLLDVCIFRSRSPWDFAVHVFKVITGREHLKDKQIMYFQTKGIKVFTPRKKNIPVHTDCEIIGHLPMEFSVLPRALSVIVP